MNRYIEFGAFHVDFVNQCTLKEWFVVIAAKIHIKHLSICFLRQSRRHIVEMKREAQHLIQQRPIPKYREYKLSKMITHMHHRQYVNWFK